MSWLPGCWYLQQLRAAITSEAKDDVLLPREVHAKLQKLRLKFRDSNAPPESHAASLANEAESIQCFIDAWNVFSTLDAEHEAYQYPLYADYPRLKALITHQVIQLRNLELLGRHKYGTGIRGTGHRAIGGALGVGKTYFLRGIALVTAALCEFAFPITFDYERCNAYHSDAATAKKGFVSIYSLLTSAIADPFPTREAEADFLMATTDADETTIAAEVWSVQEAVQKLVVEKRYPVLILDEMTAWYREGELQVRGMTLLQQLRQFGRCANVTAIISGSSASMKAQLFAFEGWKRYSSLDPTIFAMCQIPPLRELPALRAFMETCSLSFNGSFEEFLSRTGGVGRTMFAHSVHKTNAPTGRLQPVATCKDQPQFGILARFLVQQLGDEGIADYPPPMSIPEHTARTLLMQDAGCTRAEATALMDAWCDGGLLLRDFEKDHVGFLYPYHAKLINDALATDRLDLVLQAQMQVLGAHDRGYAALETLLRPHIHRLFGNVIRPGGILKRKNKQAFYTTDATTMTPFSPCEHVNQRIQWAGQAGLDDFVLENGDDDDVVLVSAWQCKAPKVATFISAGDFTEAIAKIIEAQQLPSRLNAVNVVADTFGVAAWGFCALTAILQAADPSRTYVPHKLYLCTTGILEDDARRLVDRGFDIPETLRAAFNTSSAAKKLGVTCGAHAVAHVEVIALNGIEWTKKFLPPEELICTEGLLNKERDARTLVRSASAVLESAGE